MTGEILAFDVGGTKVAAASFAPDKQGGLVLKNRWAMPSRTFDGFEAAMFSAMEALKINPGIVAVGVAGPVEANKASLTNLDWAVDGPELGEAAKAPVVLLNDLAALAFGVPSLDKGGAVTFQKGRTAAQDHKAIIAAGTGLGEAILWWDDTKGTYQPSASEGGHADFGPQDEDGAELYRFLAARYGHVSWERVVSGRDGFRNLLDFALDRGASSLSLEEVTRDKQDIGAEIIAAADAGDALAVSVLTSFVRYLGAEAGNLALKSLARGGIYIGGGIAPRIVKWLRKDGAFLKSFLAKGRFSDMLAGFPVYLITDPDTALRGAAEYGLLRAKF